MKMQTAGGIMVMGCAIFATVNAHSEDAVFPSGNRLRNASFELDDTFNGVPMRQGTEYIRCVLAGQGKCRQLPAEGWWRNDISTEGVALEKAVAHSGSTSLSLTPAAGKGVAIFSAPEMPVAAGAVTLSAWVRTDGAKGRFELEFFPAGLKPGQVPPSLAKKQVALPETVAEWTRIQLAVEAPANAAAVAWMVVESGQVYVDDVQLEAGDVPTEFDVRPEEALHLAFETVGFMYMSSRQIPEDQLPFWREGDASARRLLVRNDSRSTIKGSLEIWMGPWSKPKATCIAAMADFELEPGDVETVDLPLDTLTPDAYVIVPVLKRDGVVVLDGERLVDSTVTIGGVVSDSILKSRAAIRFGITPDIAPAKIFGVGNGMLGYGWSDNGGSWYGGWPLKHFAIAKQERFVCGRGQMGSADQAYLFAAAGVPLHRMENPGITGGAPENATFQPPGAKGGIDFWNPEGMAFLKDKAERIGKENGGNPLVASYQMANETFFAFKDGLCATAAADAHFRSWCKERHGSLDSLNRRWGTAYASWDEVEQPASASYAEEIGKRPKPEGAAAIDWAASLGNITPEIDARMKAVPGRAMDWLRWRTWSSLWMFNSFRDAARKYDRKTLYSTNLCWPNFWPQMCMPFFRTMDVTMLDVQYTSGMPRSLGNPMEMMEILEMAESNAPDKPVWGIEVYVQPQFPAEFTALQNWGLLAHGMTNNLVFAWGPYSDSGIPKEVKAWTKVKAVPMWMLIDLDGTKLPAYSANQRSREEIRRFHQKFDGLSLKRISTDVAFFVSRDTAEYISYETANKPWGSVWTRARNNLAYLLRMNGITADFVDDSTMPSAPGRFRSVIVPASYALSQKSAAKIANFARGGGTVILAGVSGVVDPWTNRYDSLGGPAWAELGWQAPGFKADVVPVDFLGADTMPGSIDETKVFKGAGVNAMPNAEALRDAAGTVVGWKRAWGKGRIIAYSTIPDSYGANPHPSRNHSAWMRQLIEAGELRHTGRWSSGTIAGTAGAHGEGAPVVEVVVRSRKRAAAREKFVFVLNQGGAGQGTVEIPVADGKWQVSDAVTGKPVTGSVVAKGILAQALSLKPWEYRVLRLKVE